MLTHRSSIPIRLGLQTFSNSDSDASPLGTPVGQSLAQQTHGTPSIPAGPKEGPCLIHPQHHPVEYRTMNVFFVFVFVFYKLVCIFGWWSWSSSSSSTGVWLHLSTSRLSSWTVVLTSCLSNSCIIRLSSSLWPTAMSYKSLAISSWTVDIASSVILKKPWPWAFLLSLSALNSWSSAACADQVF